MEIYNADSLNPYENLAIEKHLLETVERNTLRIFLWQNENTVVIGRNQNPWAECNCALLESDGGFVARRLSGGGAVFHDTGNLNFTFICSEENYDLNNNLEIIKKACETAGITAEITGRNDILAMGKKFSGNAFFHTKGNVLHHGTLLISSDTEKIKKYLTPKKEKLAAKGIKSVESRVINLNQISPLLTPQIMLKNMIAAAENICDLKGFNIPLPKKEILEENLRFFSNWEHIYGASLPFSFGCSKQFGWGNIEINLNLSSGKISQIKVFTDSLDYTIAKKIETTLLGSKLKLSDIENKLRTALPKNICEDIIKLINKGLSH